MIPAEFIESLLASVDLRDLAGRYGELYGRGADPKQHCLFHLENTPSCAISAGRFYCFGCGKKGRTLDYLMQAEGVGFRQAVGMLADFAGVQMPGKPSPVAAPAPKSRAVPAAQKTETPMQASTEGGWAALINEGQQAYTAAIDADLGFLGRKYLQSRGIEPATARAFGLGYCDGDEAYAHKRKAREAAYVGGYKYYPQQCRITLPVRDLEGQIRGYVYRSVLPDEIKSINDCSSPFFQKSQLLFGFHESLQVIKKTNSVVVTEGPFDALIAYQHGLPVTVAALTSSLSTTQLQLVFSSADTVYLALDGDAPGQSGAERTAILAAPLLSGNRTLRWVQLPDGTDPAEFIADLGIEAFGGLCHAAPCAIQRLVANRIEEARDISGSTEIDLAGDECLGLLRPYLSQLPPGKTRTNLVTFLASVFCTPRTLERAFASLGLQLHQSAYQQ